MARIVPPRWRTLLFLAVVVPLWSSILVRIFAWRTILGSKGVLNSFLLNIGVLDHPSATFLYNEQSIALTWAYVWLPFMVLPIYTALEKIPDSYVEASRDLGGSPVTTFRRVIFPLALPGVVAGRSSCSRSRWATSSRRSSWAAARRCSAARSRTASASRRTSRSAQRWRR